MVYAICDRRIPEECREALGREGIIPLYLKAHPALSPAISSHTDILLFSDGKRLITTNKIYRENREVFDTLSKDIPTLTLLLTDDALGSEYPSDVAFCALLSGNKLFLRTESASAELLSYAEERGLDIINVRQGYTACTSLSFGNAAITADSGMARALEAAGLRVTRIRESEKISLPPHANGFIGGSSGVLGKTVYFLGNLDAHPDADIIKEAIEAEGYAWRSLSPAADRLFDLGGIRFFVQSVDYNGEDGQ